MSAKPRLPLVAGVTGAAAAASLAVFAAVPSFRTHLGLQTTGGVWRVLLVAVALLNVKNLPFVWHFRLFRALFYQLRLQPTPLRPASLFEPIITSSHAPLFETDYNVHKSNSTYFSDLDISRTHLIGALFRKGIVEADKKRKNGEDGHHMALGGVTCHFKREIAPYSRYEIWTRLLSWDRKWIYLVSHVVEAGAFKPTTYTLQPKRAGRDPVDQNDTQYRERLKRAVYASSISKYVVKCGRMTVPTHVVMEAAGLVPPQPVSHSNIDLDSKASEEAMEGFQDGVLPANRPHWTWEEIEAERKRGLEFAEKFAALDGLHDLFDAGERGALGDFPDLLW